MGYARLSYQTGFLGGLLLVNGLFGLIAYELVGDDRREGYLFWWSLMYLMAGIPMVPVTAWLCLAARTAAEDETAGARGGPANGASQQKEPFVSQPLITS